MNARSLAAKPQVHSASVCRPQPHMQTSDCAGRVPDRCAGGVGKRAARRRICVAESPPLAKRQSSRAAQPGQEKQQDDGGRHRALRRRATTARPFWFVREGVGALGQEGDDGAEDQQAKPNPPS